MGTAGRAGRSAVPGPRTIAETHRRGPGRRRRGRRRPTHCHRPSAKPSSTPCARPASPTLRRPRCGRRCSTMAPTWSRNRHLPPAAGQRRAQRSLAARSCTRPGSSPNSRPIDRVVATVGGAAAGALTTHSDRGSPMTSKPVAVLLSDLTIGGTHSRPQSATTRHWLHTAPPGNGRVVTRSERRRPRCGTSRGSPGTGAS